MSLSILKYYFVIFLFGISSIETYAQSVPIQNLKEIEFEQMNVEVDDGLTLRESANQFYEDEDGIIWTIISTGLYRYNGYSVVNFTNYLADKYNADFGNEFGVCFLKEKDFVWYGARRGLFKIDLRTKKVKNIVLDQSIDHKNFRNYITLFEKQQDTLYVGTANGLYLVNAKTDSIMDIYNNDGVDYGFRLSSKHVHAIMPQIEKGHVWVAFGDGLYRINPTAKTMEKFETTTEIWPYSHYYYKGTRYDSILLMPSYGMGMTEFNMNSKKFTDYKTNTSLGNSWEYNIILTAFPLNDSLSFVNVAEFGFALYNRHTKKYNYLKTPNIIKEERVFMDLDRDGFVWCGIHGRIFKSKYPLIEKNQPSKPIIDISDFYVNGVLKFRPCIDGYKNLQLKEDENNVQLVYSLTKPFLYDSVAYEYKLNNEPWKPVEFPNKLEFFNLKDKNHHLTLRAKNNGQELAQTELTFKISRPFYNSPFFIPVLLISAFLISFLAWNWLTKRNQKRNQQKTEFDNKLTELEAKALRSQINPHFIFNTLNSIKFYAIKKTNEETAEFLTLFSDLIRQVLENSKQSLIPLEDEINTLISYLEIEKLRLRNSFEYDIKIDENLPMEFLIPPMIIQPFIENSIWHGLMHKETDRKLNVHFQAGENSVICVVTDNGIGRKASSEITQNRPHKSSLGIKITNDRLEKLADIYNLKSVLSINDLYDENENPAGTQVVIEFINKSS